MINARKHSIFIVLLILVKILEKIVLWIYELNNSYPFCCQALMECLKEEKVSMFSQRKPARERKHRQFVQYTKCVLSKCVRSIHFCERTLFLWNKRENSMAIIFKSIELFNFHNVTILSLQYFKKKIIDNCICDDVSTHGLYEDAKNT